MNPFSELINLYGLFYLGIASIIGSYGGAIILLSIFSSLLLLPIIKKAARVAAVEQEYQDVIEKQISYLKSECKGVQLYNGIQRIYKRYGYHPIFAVRKVSVLFVQLPFLILTYLMLGDLSEIGGKSFFIIHDLSAADGLLHGVNLLPFTMTLINILAAFSMKGLKRNDMIQAIGLSLLFLVVLYKADASLLLYWSMNNFLLLLRNMFSRLKDSEAIKISGEVAQKKHITIYSMLDIIGSSSFLSLLSLLFYYLSIQEICFLLANKGWFSIWNPQTFIFSTTSLSFVTIGLLVKRRKLTQNVAAICSLCLLPFCGFLFFLQPDENYFFLLNSLSLLFLIVATIVAWIAKGEKPFQVKIDYVTLGILGLFAGFTFHWISNTDLLFLSTLPVYFVFCLVLGLSTTLMTLPIVCLTAENKHTAIYSAIFLLSLVFLPTAHSFLIWGSYLLEYLVLSTLLFLVLSTCYKKGRGFIYLLLVCFIIGNSGVSIYTQYTTYQKTLNIKDERLESILTHLPHPVDKPNIYILISESNPDLKTLEQIGIETASFKRFLIKNKFKIYDDTYTLGHNSHLSMSKTLDIRSDIILDKSVTRLVVSGTSLVNKWFQRIGYKTAIVTKPNMTGIANSYDLRLPPIASYVKWLNCLTVLKGIGMREFKFNIVGINPKVKDKNYEDYKHELIKSQSSEPIFMLYHGEYPNHSQSSGRCLENETELFAGRYTVALEMLKKDMEIIVKNDPNSIVVIMGDHGPYLTGDCHMLTGYDPKDITELMLRDRVGTTLAIRWPDIEKARKYDDILINQDLFPAIFSYLYDSHFPQSLKLDRKVEFRERAIKDGVLLPYEDR